MALYGVVAKIFNVEKCRDLEIGVEGYSRSSEMTRAYPPPMIFY